MCMCRSAAVAIRMRNHPRTVCEPCCELTPVPGADVRHRSHDICGGVLGFGLNTEGLGDVGLVRMPAAGCFWTLLKVAGLA